MDATTLIIILAAISLALILMGLIIWRIKVNKDKHPGVSCKNNKEGWLWNDSCTAIKEVSYDSSIASPASIRPVLTEFKYTSGVGGAWYKPSWYRIRYVNPTTGAYGDFSEWTSSPVIAGSCSLPCPPAGDDATSESLCPFKEGYATCTFNAPTVGIKAADSQYDPTAIDPVQKATMQINLHRYTGDNATIVTPPAADVTDEIVGILTLTFVGDVDYYTWEDVLSPPCADSSSCTKPSWCKTPTSSC